MSILPLNFHFSLSNSDSFVSFWEQLSTIQVLTEMLPKWQEGGLYEADASDEGEAWEDIAYGRLGGSGCVSGPLYPQCSQWAKDSQVFPILLVPRVPNPIASGRLSEYTKDEAKSTEVT